MRLKHISSIGFILFILIIQANASGKFIGTFESFNCENFPQVYFVCHDYNPDEWNNLDFQNFKENGKECDYRITEIPVESRKEQCYTLILWEDMAHYGVEQYNFTRDVLLHFFEKASVGSKDKFMIAVFNRRKNNPSVLKKLTSNFTNDSDKLQQAIRTYVHSEEIYKDNMSHRSDMYSAIREGMELLQGFDGIKNIIVFTAGYPMTNSGSDSEAQVLIKSQSSHIPVYVFQYYEKHGVTSGVEGFAKDSYGLYMSYKRGEASLAIDNLVKMYPQIIKRYNGHSYKISFQTEAKRGDGSVNISFNIKGEQIDKQLVPPPFDLVNWMKDNIFLTIVLILLCIAILVLAILLIFKSMRKNSEMEGALANTRKDIDKINKDINDKHESEKKDAEDKRIAAEQQQLLQTMRNKNMYPRLKCQVENKMFIYNVEKPIITIGRNDDNDVVLPNDKVSRYHAKIVFNGVQFEIFDKNSTNKVILNGQIVTRNVLVNGDMIGLGEALILFNV